jgi:hypothetical protein
MSAPRSAHVLVLGLLLGSCDPAPPPPATPTPPTEPAKAAAPVDPPEPAKAPRPATQPAAAKPAAEAPAPAPGPIVVQLGTEENGAPSPAFEAVVGDWYVGEADGQKGLWVDGTSWRHGTPSASLADQAKRLYGERYAEFLDNVKAFAFFPLAVYTGEVPAGGLRLSVRFYAEAGRIDQAAGIAWNIAPDGSYFGARANPLEDNILFFRYQRGKRTILQTVRGVSTPSKQWHTFAVRLEAGQAVVELDGKEHLRREFTEPLAGRVGLWSKADSKVLFSELTIEPLDASAPAGP